MCSFAHFRLAGNSKEIMNQGEQFAGKAKTIAQIARFELGTVSKTKKDGTNVLLFVPGGQ